MNLVLSKKIKFMYLFGSSESVNLTLFKPTLKLIKFFKIKKRLRFVDDNDRPVISFWIVMHKAELEASQLFPSK